MATSALAESTDNAVQRLCIQLRSWTDNGGKAKSSRDHAALRHSLQAFAHAQDQARSGKIIATAHEPRLVSVVIRTTVHLNAGAAAQQLVVLSC